MGTVEALGILAQLLNTITNSVAQANQISTIVAGAQSQGRTSLTPEEWGIVNQANAQSRAALVDSINKAFQDAGLSTRVA